MPRDQCPSNPYFYTWVKELRDSAKEKDNKSYHCYSRALKALNQYPLPLRSGEEAKCVQYIGDKMARLIDTKVKEFYKERGHSDEEIEHFMLYSALEKLPTVQEKLTKSFETAGRKRKKKSPPDHATGGNPTVGTNKRKPPVSTVVTESVPSVPAPTPSTLAPDPSISAPDPYNTTPASVLDQFNAILAQLERESAPAHSLNVAKSSNNAHTRTEKISKGTNERGKEKACKRGMDGCTNSSASQSPVMIEHSSPQFTTSPAIDRNLNSPPRLIPMADVSSSSSQSTTSKSPSISVTISPSKSQNYHNGPSSSASSRETLSSRVISVSSSKHTQASDCPEFIPIVRWSPTPLSSMDIMSDEDESLPTSPPKDGIWHYCYIDENNVQTLSRGRAGFLESADLTGLWLKAKTYTDTLSETDKLYMEATGDSSEDSRYKHIYIESSYCDLRAPGLPLLRKLKPGLAERDSEKGSSDTKSLGKTSSGKNSAAAKRAPLISSPQQISSSSTLSATLADDIEKMSALPDISDSEEELESSNNPAWWDEDRLTQVMKTGLKPVIGQSQDYVKFDVVKSDQTIDLEENSMDEVEIIEIQSQKKNCFALKAKADDKVLLKNDVKFVPKNKTDSYDIVKPSNIAVKKSIPPTSVCPKTDGESSASGAKSVLACQRDNINRTPEESSRQKCATVLYSFSPGSFKVSLCVDNAEVNTKKQQILLQELTRNGVDFEVRKLQIGDFVWLARDNSGRELVCDVIIERKRMDDLAQSITGGRFAEQKLRLKQCGIKRKIYLVETKASYLSLPESSLNQAIVNTQVTDGFTIKKTVDIKESAAYLTLLSNHLQLTYKDRELHGITEPELTGDDKLLTFDSFSKNSVKNRVLTVREVFLMQLTRIPKISQDKAEAIIEVYPTPKHLISALEKLDDKSSIVSEIKFGLSRRKIGIAASRMVAGMFSLKPLH